MFDILDITEPQARVLRAIAYVESKLGKKGATQYLCYKKVPNGFHVSNSTFSEKVKDLEKKLMVLRYEDSDSKRDSIPYTITDIGQIAWLRHFPLTENVDIIKKVFPNIQISAINNIISKIEHTGTKHMLENYSLGILENALENFHMLEGSHNVQSMTRGMKEVIELSGDNNLTKTSYVRYYQIDSLTFMKKLTKKELLDFNKIFQDIQISVINRITFLFYYNLIQSIIDKSYKMQLIKTMPIESDFNKMSNEKRKKTQGLAKKEFIKMLNDLSGFQKRLTSKKSEFLTLINSNVIVSKIMKDNLKQLKTYKDTSFQDISSMFHKV